MDKNTINRLKRWIEEAGLVAVAKEVGVGNTDTISAWVAGHRKPKNVSRMRLLDCLEAWERSKRA